MDRWEYIVCADIGEADLNACGNVGWELVTVRGAYQGHIHFYFKRRLPPAEKEGK